jgi:hypothetical protein
MGVCSSCFQCYTSDTTPLRSPDKASDEPPTATPKAVATPKAATPSVADTPSPDAVTAMPEVAATPEVAVKPKQFKVFRVPAPVAAVTTPAAVTKKAKAKKDKEEPLEDCAAPAPPTSWSAGLEKAAAPFFSPGPPSRRASLSPSLVAHAQQRHSLTAHHALNMTDEHAHRSLAGSLFPPGTGRKAPKATRAPTLAGAWAK